MCFSWRKLSMAAPMPAFVGQRTARADMVAFRTMEILPNAPPNINDAGREYNGYENVLHGCVKYENRCVE